jgi:L-ascorbate metabolism protein UlaG (beta-lactamase superfamily)
VDKPISFRWLGVAGIELCVGRRVLLIDPFVSRPPFRRMLFGRVEPDHALITNTISPCDTVLVTHAHWDHLMDVPDVARRAGATVYGSPNVCTLLRFLGLPRERLHALAAGDHLSLDGVEVEVLSAVHGTVLGRPIFTGPVPDILRPPLRLRDYRMDRDFTFLVEAAGYRLLDWSSECAEGAVGANMLFVKPFSAPTYYAELLRTVRPRVVIPIHWDDLFRPLSRPVRPMISPPSWSIPPLRREDLAAFRRMIQQIAPQARVFVPDMFRRYDLGQLLQGPAPLGPDTSPDSVQLADLSQRDRLRGAGDEP